jgi:hypothetical protein
MRNVLHWLGAAIEAQPFYANDIGMIRLAIETWRHSLPGIDWRF